MQSFASQLLGLHEPKKQQKVAKSVENKKIDYFSVIGQLEQISKQLDEDAEKAQFIKVEDLRDRMLVVIVRYYKVVGTEWTSGKDAAKQLQVAPTLFSRNMNLWADMGIVEFDKSVYKKFTWRFTANGAKIAEDYIDGVRPKCY